ncbi:MAG: integrase arm-type DNA-binding domain-containing protein [Terracidiphilus sp.]|jgi:integrase
MDSTKTKKKSSKQKTRRFAPLTDKELQAIGPTSKRYTLRDGRGLFLDVTPGGVRTWVFRYQFNGKQEKFTIGRYPEFSLKEAREKRDELAVEVSRGVSPAEEKQKERAKSTTGNSKNPTVMEFGERYLKEQVDKNWKDPSNERRNLEKGFFPEFGDRLLKDVTAVDIQLVVYRKRDGGHPAAAICLRNTIKRMYDYAVETHCALINPAAMVATKYIGKAVRRKRHLPPKEIREFLQTIYRSNIRRQFKLAFHIILLTLVRKSMLLLATWDEIDYGTGEWTIPKEHVKAKKGEEHEHVVYISMQVAAMFRELKALAGSSRFVLPGRGKQNQPFAANALNKALEGLTFDMEPFTIHDQRRTASTLLNENASGNGWTKDVIEKALSHEKVGIAGVYNRAEYAKQRKKMLQWWADYVDSIITESKVIVGNFGRR